MNHETDIYLHRGGGAHALTNVSKETCEYLYM